MSKAVTPEKPAVSGKKLLQITSRGSPQTSLTGFASKSIIIQELQGISTRVSSNGRTSDSGSECRGSNPCTRANSLFPGGVCLMGLFMRKYEYFLP